MILTTDTAELQRTQAHAMQLARECRAQGSTRAAMEYLREVRRINQVMVQRTLTMHFPVKLIGEL